ncbi:MAG: prepilin-type N-terminal cleavage/methylation domain-containing protein [bacterium]|nr:prepilin-type N-terminal cleavage/methylation domain-containing protein [Candidatus Sumerlaeota bacterium]
MMMMKSARSAFAFIELLLVLVVLAILASGYFGVTGNLAQNRATYETSITRANDTACKANRTVMRTTIQLYSISNPGKPVTIEAMRQTGQNLPTCPGGGQYKIQPDGTITCGKHPG